MPGIACPASRGPTYSAVPPLPPAKPGSPFAPKPTTAAASAPLPRLSPRPHLFRRTAFAASEARVAVRAEAHHSSGVSAVSVAQGGPGPAGCLGSTHMARSRSKVLAPSEGAAALINVSRPRRPRTGRLLGIHPHGTITLQSVGTVGRRGVRLPAVARMLRRRHQPHRRHQPTVAASNGEPSEGTVRASAFPPSPECSAGATSPTGATSPPLPPATVSPPRVPPLPPAPGIGNKPPGSAPLPPSPPRPPAPAGPEAVATVPPLPPAPGIGNKPPGSAPLPPSPPRPPAPAGPLRQRSPSGQRAAGCFKARRRFPERGALRWRPTSGEESGLRQRSPSGQRAAGCFKARRRFPERGALRWRPTSLNTDSAPAIL